LKVRELYHSGNLSKEVILSRVPSLTESELNAIIAEADDLEDFRLEKFNTLVRKLHGMVDTVVDSVTMEDLEQAPVAARASMLRVASDVMRKTYELQIIEQQKSDDMALARLLAMGRDEARRQLLERFRGLFHVLFGGMAPDEAARQLGLLHMQGAEAADKIKAYALDEADVEDVTDSSPGLKLVAGERPDRAESGGRGASTQGIGAFRGTKESKSS
jgi:hypothetical protein